MSEAQMDAMIPEWDLADRMRKALQVSGIGVQEMADYLGVARNTVSTWINGRNRPSPAAVRLWAMRCGVPYEWLATGGVRTAPIRSSASFGGWDDDGVWHWNDDPDYLDDGPPDDPDDDEQPVNLYRSLLGLASNGCSYMAALSAPGARTSVRSLLGLAA